MGTKLEREWGDTPQNVRKVGGGVYRRTVWLILWMEQRCVGDLVAMQEPHCCCLDLCQIWVRLAVETESPSDLRGPAGVMEGLNGGGREVEREKEGGE